MVTGIIKANFATRIAFRCATKVDSGVILDRQSGASQLLGNGDALFMDGGLTRVHGTWISPEEIEEVNAHWRGLSSPELTQELS